MSEAKPLTAPQEEVLRQSMYWGEKSAIAAQIWATLDAERAKVEEMENSRLFWSREAGLEAARATAAEAERNLLQDLLARYGDRVRMSMSARPEWQEAIDAALSAAEMRAAAEGGEKP